MCRLWHTPHMIIQTVQNCRLTDFHSKKKKKKQHLTAATKLWIFYETKRLFRINQQIVDWTTRFDSISIRVPHEIWLSGNFCKRRFVSFFIVISAKQARLLTGAHDDKIEWSNVMTSVWSRLFQGKRIFKKKTM